jgi:5,10-methenyltetrahydromethanopterin hydrogenase
VVEFFKEENEKNFQKLKDKASKLVGPSKLIHYPSADGTLICDPKYDSAYLPKVRDYLAASEGLEKKLKRDSEKLMEKLREASEALHTYSDTLKQLTAVQDMIPNVIFK